MKLTSESVRIGKLPKGLIRVSRSRVRRGKSRGLRLAAIVLGMVGCSSPPPSQPLEKLDSEVESLYQEALELRDQSSFFSAFGKVKKCLERAPDSVQVHRLYQNLALGNLERGSILESYERHLSERPNSPAAWYLAGRVHTEPDIQEQYFSRSLDLDPAYYWGHIGMGYAALRMGRGDDALWHFQKAGEGIRFGAYEALSGVVRLFLGAGEHQRASVPVELLRMLHRDKAEARRLVIRYELERGEVRRGIEESLALLECPLDSAINVPFMGQILIDRGTPLDWQRGLSLLEKLEGPPFRELEGRLSWRLGDFERALTQLNQLSPRRLDGTVRREWRYVQIVMGQYEAAFEEDQRDLPVGVIGFDRLSERREALEGSIAAFRKDPGSFEELRIASAMKSMGWVQEALAVSDRLKSDPWVCREASKLSTQLKSFTRFDTAVRAYFDEVYKREDDDDDAPDLNEALEDLRRLSFEHLGGNVIDPVVIRDYSPIGAFVDPTVDAGSGLVRYYGEYNRFILIGRRLGLPVEGISFRRVVLGDLEGEWNERVELMAGDTIGIPSYLHRRGQKIFGAALFGFTFLDLDAMRSESNQIIGLADSVGEPWLGERGALAGEPESFREPLDIAARLHLQVGREFENNPSELTAAVLDSVLSHEVAHLLDARLFWPLFDNLIPNLWRFIKSGFSPFRIEAWLEERAQVRGQAKSKWPRLALASSTSFLSQGGSHEEPHALGYGDAMARFVEILKDHPDSFPSLDPSRPLIQQLDRLSDEEIAAVSRTLYHEDFGDKD